MGLEIPALIALGATAASTGVAIYGQQQQAKSAEAAAKYNNQLAEAEARNKELEFAESANRARIQKRKQMAQIRTAMAAGGALTTEGTPLAILGDSSANLELSIADAARAANMQAASFRSQGRMGLWEAKQTRSAANIASIGSVFGGIGQAADSFHTFKFGYNPYPRVKPAGS